MCTCKCVHICICVYMYVSACVYTCVYLAVCMHVCLCVCVYFLCMCIHMWLPVCNVCVRAHAFSQMCWQSLVAGFRNLISGLALAFRGHSLVPPWSAPCSFWAPPCLTRASHKLSISLVLEGLRGRPPTWCR